MLVLSVETRKILGKKVKTLRQKGVLPGVVYGSKMKSLPLKMDLKEFESVFKEAGESSLISLNIIDSKERASESSQEDKKEKTMVLIRDVNFDPITGELTHVDFYKPKLGEEIEATVPLVFEGEAPAVKELGGTLIKNISELEVKALPQNLPHEIKINVDGLKSFEDYIFVKNLELPKNVKVLKNPEERIASVVPPEKVEEELEKPIEEKVEDVEKVEEKKKEEPEAEEKEKK